MVLRSKNTSVNNRKKPKKHVPLEHHREQKAINLILIWTAFFKGTIDVEQNQRISQKKTQYLRLSKMYRMRKTSRHFLNHLMMKKSQKSIAVEETIDTNNGAMLVKSYGLKRNNKTDRNFKCQEVNFLEVKKTQEELNKHLQFDHKITFKCFVCDRMYETVNGRNKHYKKHFKFNNTCLECSYSCQFPVQMKCAQTVNIQWTLRQNSHVPQEVAAKFSSPRLL